ncbi:hypothetical protein HY404_02030 [Candidatus Microgenomates bacterium]|nr:hypothetical protein [Candidatus Microgenomates bacterium]
MTSEEVRRKYIEFFVRYGHQEIPSASLVPENDPSTLFTSAGMQPLVPYLLGKPHPQGKRLVNSQKCFRAQDIEEVGDNRHTTFFEMLGNWSLGDYFKKEQLPWFWQFLTEELKLSHEKLYVSIFDPSASLGTGGNSGVPKDNESYEIWKSLGVPEDHIFAYGVEKNWWSRSGTPEQMPAGEIGGPDSEVFYEFTQVEHDPRFGDKCHPNCDCGRFVEIGNSVFIQYQKQADGTLQELTQKNVDFGGGLERMTAATNDNPDIFETDLFSKIITAIENISGRSYQDIAVSEQFEIITDHMKAATFIIASDILPSNKMQGYVLRRLLRRAAVKFNSICGSTEKPQDLAVVSGSVIDTYAGTDMLDISKKDEIADVIRQELDKFGKTLERGLAEIEKIAQIDGKIAFDLYQTYGFPLEVLEELFAVKGQKIDRQQFNEEFSRHQQVSRQGVK